MNHPSRVLITLFMTGAFQILFAAEKNGQLDHEAIAAIRASFEQDQTSRAYVNAVSNNDIKKLVLNRELMNDHNDIYNLEIEVKGITNQESTGRCWMFAALNVMRPVVLKKYNLAAFEFSQAHLFFWDKLEKANYFLESIIETRDRDIDDRELQALLTDPVPDGGWWNYAVNLIQKYGVIPKTSMGETENTSHSKMLNKTIGYLARQCAVELRAMSAQGIPVQALRERKMEMLKDFYRLLVFHFGMPPEHFTWRVRDKDNKLIEKEFTPLSFYREAAGLDLGEYITLCDYPAFPYRDLYQVRFCTNMPEQTDMHFINLNSDKLKHYALQSLKSGEPVWFGGDSGWQMERDQGIMADNIFDYSSLFHIDDTMNKAEAIRYRAITANHAMVLVAADTTADGRVHKWRVENSWGADKGNKGYWAMYDSWFDRYVITVIIHKKHIEKEILRLLENKPVMIPAWDPMRNCFR